MSGALLAAAAGVGFGVFQATNARALRGTDDPYASTLVQLSIAAVALAAACVVTGDVAGAGDAPLWALADFAAAGLIHFFAGWSLLNLSQQRIGAARTSPLLTTVPVFGVAVAFVTVGQKPSAVALAAIAIMCLGAYVVASRGGHQRPRAADALPGLGCALMWAVSPVLTVHGLEGFHSALVGITVGLLVSIAVFLPCYLLVRGSGAALAALAGATAPLKLFAGVLVGLSTWWRWAALEGASVGVVLALSLLSVPVVLFLAPVIAGRHREQVGGALWAGAGLVVSGALILVVA
jgi:drug/metabolite transporter (DMT)-like permease